MRVLTRFNACIHNPTTERTILIKERSIYIKSDRYLGIMDDADELIEAAKLEGREISLETALEIIKIRHLKSIADRR